jgi:hypothetical protein
MDNGEKLGSRAVTCHRSERNDGTWPLGMTEVDE